MIDKVLEIRMVIKRLKHLVALADERNFSRAAERVHLSQPAFSRSVQSAEAELGLQLFDRGSLEVSCTSAGNFVIERLANCCLTAAAWSATWVCTASV